MGWAEQGFLGVEAEVVGSKTRTGPLENAEIGTSGYTLFNIQAGAQHRWGAHRLRLDIGLRNAFDKGYHSFLSRYKEFAPDPGRNLVVRFSTDF